MDIFVKRVSNCKSTKIFVASSFVAYLTNQVIPSLGYDLVITCYDLVTTWLRNLVTHLVTHLVTALGYSSSLRHIVAVLGCGNWLTALNYSTCFGTWFWGLVMALDYDTW